VVDTLIPLICMSDGTHHWNIADDKKESPVYITIRRNNSSFRQIHAVVPDVTDGSDGTSHPPTENYTLPIAQAIAPSLLDSSSALLVHLGVPGSTLNHSREVWENNFFFFFGNAAGAPGKHSYY
jgi:hypothetical protein